MRRIGNIMDEIVDYSNMYDSFKQVVRGKKRKQSISGRRITENIEKVLKELSQSLSDGTFKIHGYKEMQVFEHGKQRNIQVLSMSDRIAINAVMKVVDKYLYPQYIRTTSASIKGRGMHDLMKYVYDDIKNNPSKTCYCLKIDINKFYESIDQEVMLKCVKQTFKDKVLLTLLERFITMTPKGLSMGLRSSQGLANLLLSKHIDHYLKDELGVSYYYRYCDDIVILSSSKEYLWEVYQLIDEKLAQIKLKIKNNVRVFPTQNGIDFLGYVIYPDHVLLRKRIKQKFARQMHEIHNKDRRKILTASFYGMAKHANCNNLFKKLTNIEMKSFSELKVQYAPADGKKRFPGQSVSLRSLTNAEIEVHDYEKGVETANGKDRYLVSIKVVRTGEWKKFFTNSEEMKNILDQIAEIEDGFPFKTIIEVEVFDGNKTKYKFT